ncbi:MAG: hypothetical protein ACM3ME_06700 [Chloroflexota bacterium]
MSELNLGTELTINADTIDNSGCIHFKRGQKVIVREVVKHGGYYSWGYWIKERIIGVKLMNEYGIYFLSLFTETKEIQK